MFSEERFAQAEDDVEKLLKLVEVPGKTVLDLCCGPGRISIALAKRGFAVTGVDRTAFLLDKAKERAKSANVQVEWIQEDMRNFLRPGAFDLVLNMFTSFGYFDNKDEDVKVLENMFTNLKPGGACVIDVFGKEMLAKIYQPTHSEAVADGSILVERHEIFDEWTRIRNEWILIKDGKAKTFKFHHTVYSAQELRDRLEKVGFHKVRIYGNLDGKPYGLDAERLIAAACKPV